MQGQGEIPGLPERGLGTAPRQIPDLPQEYSPGWNDLVAAAHRELVAADPHYRAFQVKTKFGGLRLYLDGDEALRPIIDKYERASYTVCEFCGKPGTLVRIGHWWATLCPGDEAANREGRAKRWQSDMDED